MATVSLNKTYVDNEALYQADIDALIDSIEEALNLTKLNDDNIQDSGITASTKLIDGTITAAKIASSAITTAKIADDAITTAKIVDDAITTAKITDGEVVSGHFEDKSVGRTKIQTRTTASVTASGTFTTTSSSLTDVTGVTTSYTTNGGLLLFMLDWESGYVAGASGAGSTTAVIAILQDGAVIFSYEKDLSSSSGTHYLSPIVSAHFVSTGTYTFKAQAKTATGTVTLANPIIRIVEI